MTLEQFEALLASYGADFSKWPDAQENTARAFLAQREDEVAEQYRNQQKLDDALACITPQKPRAELYQQIYRSFTPTLLADRFGFAVLGNFIFGPMVHARSMALASVFTLTLLGGIGGYLGAGQAQELSTQTEILSLAFSEYSFELETDT